MGPEPGEPVDVRPCDVHENRLRGVIEVQAGRDVVRADLPCRPVQRLAAEDAAVPARDRVRVKPHDHIHLEADRLAVGDDAVLDAEPRAQVRGDFNPPRAVRCDALVDRDRHEFHVGPLRNEVVEERRGGAAVLPAAEADRDAEPRTEIHFSPHLVLHALLDEREEVVPTQMGAAVSDPRDGGRATTVATHVSRIGSSVFRRACHRMRPWSIADWKIPSITN